MQEINFTISSKAIRRAAFSIAIGWTAGRAVGSLIELCLAGLETEIIQKMGENGNIVAKKACKKFEKDSEL